MKIALISDIHSNLEALETAFRAISETDAEVMYCLGDVVGYGADPAPCVELVREYCDGVVLGNHDAAVAREEGIGTLPKDARKAAQHNAALLSEEQRAYLADLPLRIEAHGCTFVHASPDKPAAWKRLDSYPVAQAQFKHFDTDICFIGHTHIPAVMADKLGVLNVRKGHRYLVNIGSVGQPRDRNPRLSFALFDTDAFAYDLIRVPYNVERAAEKILTAGLPKSLATRLKEGR